MARSHGLRPSALLLVGWLLLPLTTGACRPASSDPGASAAPADVGQSPSRAASAPRILSQPQSAATREGDPIILKVVANGVPAPTYQWMHDGAVIPGATAGTLRVPSAGASDGGTYRVTVSNDAGSVVSEPAAVAVQAVSSPPTITGLPPDLLINEGAASVLKVDVSGTGPFTYVWRKESRPAFVSTEAALWLQNPRPEDSGFYTLEVSNAVGRTTATCRVTVTPRLPRP